MAVKALTDAQREAIALAAETLLQLIGYFRDKEDIGEFFIGDQDAEWHANRALQTLRRSFRAETVRVELPPKPHE